MMPRGLRVTIGTAAVAATLWLASYVIRDIDTIHIPETQVVGAVDFNHDGIQDLVTVEDVRTREPDMSALVVYDGKFVTSDDEGRQARSSKMLAHRFMRDPAVVGWGEKKYLFGKIDDASGYDIVILEANSLFDKASELASYRNILPE